MSKKQRSLYIVDSILDGNYSKVLESDRLVDKYLNLFENENLDECEEINECGECVKSKLKEHDDNFIPEVPDTSKTPARDIKNALSKNNPKIDSSVDSPESEDNILSTVPDESNTPGKDIKRALSGDNPNITSDVKNKINECLSF